MASFKHYKVANNEQTPILGEAAPESTLPFVQRMEEDMNITIISLNDEEIEFDLTGVDAAIANALRRILLAEVCSSQRSEWTFHNCFTRCLLWQSRPFIFKRTHQSSKTKSSPIVSALFLLRLTLRFGASLHSALQRLLRRSVPQ